MRIILVGHGQTALAFKDAVEMIFGNAPDLKALSFLPDEGLSTLTDKIAHAIEANKANETLIITDLFSGTPYNAAAGLVLSGKAADVISGMSLPMLLEIITSMANKNVKEMVEQIWESRGEYVKCLSLLETSSEDEEDFQ